MPAINKLYTNEEDYIYDQVRDSVYFDETEYNDRGAEYLYALYAYRENKDAEAIDFSTWRWLPSGEKTNYLAYNTGLLTDAEIKKYTGLETGTEYFSKLAEEGYKQYEWDQKNGWDKFWISVGDTLKSIAIEMYGTIEGLIDFVPALIGQSEFVAQDTTGVGAAREQLQESLKYNTWLNQGFGKYVYGALTSMGKMAPLALNMAVPGLGSAIYYTSLAGSTAEETWKTLGTDTNYFEVLSHTALQTGAEYIGEKIFSSAFLGGWINTAGLKSKNFLANFIMSGIEEGSEEVVTELLNFGINAGFNAISGTDKYDVFQPEGGLGQGILDSFITGALMGGLTAGAGVAFTSKITLPNGKTLTKTQSYLWKSDFAKDISEAAKFNSAVYELKLKQGAKFSTSSKEYRAALNKDRKTIRAAGKALQTIGALRDVLGKNKMKAVELSTTKSLNNARQSIRNFWLEYSDPTYKEYTSKVSARNEKYVSDFNATHEGTLFTAVNDEYHPEINAIENAFVGSGKVAVPVKMGNENGNIQPVFVVDPNSNAVFINVDRISDMSINDILVKSMEIGNIELLSKNTSIIEDSFLRELFNKKTGKRLTEQEKTQIAYEVLFNPKTIATIVGCKKSLAKKIFKNLKNQAKSLNLKTKANKIKYNQLNKAIDRYKLQLVINAGKESALEYLSKEYGISLDELKEIYNLLTNYNFNEHFISEKLNMSTLSEHRLEALNFLNNQRKVELIKAEKTVKNPRDFLDESIYKPEFVAELKQKSKYREFKYALNEFLFETYDGLHFNNEGELNSARNLMREFNPEFLSAFDSMMNELHLVRESNMSYPEAVSEIYQIIERFNNHNYIVANAYNNEFLSQIQIEDTQSKIMVELPNDQTDAYARASYNPAEDIIRIYVNLEEFTPGIKTEKTTDKNGKTTIKEMVPLTPSETRLDFLDSFIHESIHPLSKSKVGYSGTNSYAIENFLRSSKGQNALKLLKLKLYGSYENAEDIEDIADLVYLLTFGELEASRHKTAQYKRIMEFLEQCGFDIRFGTALMEDGFKAHADGRVIGVGHFRGIIIETAGMLAERREVSFEAISEEGAAKETETAAEDLDFSETLAEREETAADLVNAVKEFSKNKTKENFIRIGDLADKLNMDVPGYNWDRYDKLKEADKPKELTKEEKLERRKEAIRAVIKKGDPEELSKLEIMYKSTNKEKLINELGEDAYNELLAEINNAIKSGVKSRVALTTRIRYLKSSVEKKLDSLSQESKDLYEELLANWGNKEYVKNMTIDQLEDRARALEAIKNDVPELVTKEQIRGDIKAGKATRVKLETTEEAKSETSEDYKEKIIESVKKEESETTTLAQEPDENIKFVKIEPEKSATRAISEEKDEEIVVDKKPVSSKISKKSEKPVEKKKISKETSRIISELKDITYRTNPDSPYASELKLSKSREFKGDKYSEFSQQDFLEKNEDVLSQITEENVDDILDAIQQPDFDQENAMAILNYLYTHEYLFNDRQSERIAEASKLSVRKAAKKLATWRWALEEEYGVSSAASQIKRDYGVKVTIKEETLSKYLPEFKKYGWDKYKQITIDEINELEQELKITDDKFKKFILEKKLRQLKKLARILAKKDAVGLIQYKLDRLLEQDANSVENAEIAGDLSKDVVQELIDQVDGLKKLFKPAGKERGKSILSPAAHNKVLRFLKKARSIRYLFMLSSVSTATRNAVSNTSVGISKVMENLAGKGIEKFFKKSPESQVSYYGDYDSDFSDFIDDNYAAWISQVTKTGTKWEHTKAGDIKREVEIEEKFKSKTFKAWSRLEEKMLSDTPWTKRATIKNLKHMISGGQMQLTADILNTLRAQYSAKTNEELMNIVKESNPELYARLSKIQNKNKGYLEEIVKLADELKVNLLVEIMNKAHYRAERQYFKTSNPISRAIGRLNETHPIVGEIVSVFVPFARVSWNTTMYALEHSPVGLAMATIKNLQRIRGYIADQRAELEVYAQSLYHTYKAGMEEKRLAAKGKKEKAEYWALGYEEWAKENLSEDYKAALNGNDKKASEIYKKLVAEGKIPGNTIGLNDPFARADVIELYSSGAIGTAYMLMGLLLALTGAFEIDDDDYMGLVLRLGDVKIKLQDLAPFSTAFTFGAGLLAAGKGTFGENLKASLSAFYDQTLMGTVESVMGYNSSITEILEYQGINYIQQYIPSIVKQIAKVVDPNVKKKSGDFWGKLADTTASNIPGLSYLVPNKINPYTGKAETRYSIGSWGEAIHMINPLKIVNEGMSDVEREATRVGATTTGLSGRFSINGTDYSLNTKDLEKYSIKRANYVNEKLTELFDSSAYRGLSDEDKAKEIDKIYSQATEIAKINYWLDSKNNRRYIFTDRSKFTDWSRYIENKSKIYFRTKWKTSKYVEE